MGFLRLKLLTELQIILSNMKSPTIETPKGFGEIDKIYVSELGFLMVKVSYENGTYTTYNFGKHDVNNNMFTNEMLKDKNPELTH